MRAVSPVMPALVRYEKPGIIYVAINRRNGKAYIGQTISPFPTRRSAHKKDAEKGSQCPFHTAIRKWGFDAFEFIVLQRCCGRHALDFFEKMWISASGSLYPNGYNLTPGGDGGTRTAEHARRISMAKLGKKRPNMTGPNHPLFGKSPTAATRLLLSEATKLQMTAEARAELSRLAIGRKHSEATKKKISEVGKQTSYRGENHPWFNRAITQEERTAVSARFKGKPKSKEHRENISAALLGREKPWMIGNQFWRNR